MKIRFYVDVPIEATTSQQVETWGFCAQSQAPGFAPTQGFKRVAFDVDLPIKMVEIEHIQDGKVVE